MHTLRRTLLISILFFPFFLTAQPNSGDIRPMLKSLTIDQKLQLLEYMRHLGADIDNEIQHAYTRVSRKDQFKAIQFIESFKSKKQLKTLTTVNWEKDTLFFKDLTAGELLIDSFAVTNTGKAPYLIKQTKATCDCTVLRAPKHPVMPGETAYLRFEFNSSGKLGQSQPAIIVYDNSIPNKRHILYLKGNIAARKKPKKYPWED